MSKPTSHPSASITTSEDDIQVSIPKEQAAVGAAGAVVGAVVAGPIGAVVGGVLGAVASSHRDELKQAAVRVVKSVREKLPSRKTVVAVLKTKARTVAKAGKKMVKSAAATMKRGAQGAKKKVSAAISKKKPKAVAVRKKTASAVPKKKAKKGGRR